MSFKVDYGSVTTASKKQIGYSGSALSINFTVENIDLGGEIYFSSTTTADAYLKAKWKNADEYVNPFEKSGIRAVPSSIMK